MNTFLLLAALNGLPEPQAWEAWLHWFYSSEMVIEQAINAREAAA